MKITIDTSTIDILKIIVHSIPKHKKGDYSVEPQYSEQESEVPDGLRTFFKDKVKQSLDSSKELKVCYDSENESPVSTYVNQILNSNGVDFIEQSKLMTKYLFQIQDGQNASGILVVVYGTINDKNTCILLKLERDEGAQLQLDPITRSFNIKAVEDLMLTKKTKIYKVGLLFNRDDFKLKYDGITADLQIDTKTKKEVTTWFIEKFLGCKPFEDPKITTKKFYNFTTTFIQTFIEDPIIQTKYTQDLNSYVQKNSNSLSASEFADDYMKTEDKNKYKAYLEDKNFRMSSFPKDISQIGSQVTKIILTFENNISIVGNKGTFDNKVKLEKLDNGQHKAEIVSKIKSVK